MDISRYVRKKRLVKTRKRKETEKKEESSKNEDQTIETVESDEDVKSLEKIEKAKKKIELLLEKRKEIKQKKEAVKVSLINNFQSEIFIFTTNISYSVWLLQHFALTAFCSNSILTLTECENRENSRRKKRNKKKRKEDWK